jgi:hypothetical protein
MYVNAVNHRRIHNSSGLINGNGKRVADVAVNVAVDVNGKPKRATWRCRRWR